MLRILIFRIFDIKNTIGIFIWQLWLVYLLAVIVGILFSWFALKPLFREATGVPSKAKTLSIVNIIIWTPLLFLFVFNPFKWLGTAITLAPFIAMVIFTLFEIILAYTALREV